MANENDIVDQSQMQKVLVEENARLLKEAQENAEGRKDMADVIAKLQYEQAQAELKVATMRREMAILDDELKKIRSGELPAPRPLPSFGKDGQKDAMIVVESFREFLKTYYLFKQAYKLPHTMPDVRDIIMGLADKSGRLCRLAKHEHRKDPIPGSKDKIAMDAFGVLAYVVMLVLHYDIDMREGAYHELIKGVEQHSEK